MDERVAMAISHWSPRFTTHGVTAGDDARITGGRPPPPRDRPGSGMIGAA